MVNFLLILFAVVALYASVSWILDGFKNDDGGKIFGSIILIVVLGLIVCYFFDFVYPIIVLIGSMAVMLTIIGLGLLTDDSAVFSGSSILFGIITWTFGILAAYACVQLMLTEGWFTVCECLIAAFAVFSGIAVIKRAALNRRFSLGHLITYVLLITGGFLISNHYPVDHLSVTLTLIVMSVIAILVPGQFVRRFSVR